MAQHEITTATLGLDELSIDNRCKVFHKPHVRATRGPREAVQRGLVRGQHHVRRGVAGRSPKDKFILKQEPSQWSVWWGLINQATTPEEFRRAGTTGTLY
ncbi:hypothetical protein V7S43_014389 [Phytophthora oleae]|uniref:Uncharacterized protein n=1 Tax=Phytophthora oleae TaxID=2107226 RepID=A0ABD3F6D7_9STRA